LLTMKHKALKLRFYPNEEQAQALAQTFGCVRYSYNEILRRRTNAYYNDGESIGYSGASAMLTSLKKETGVEWLKDVSAVPLQQAIRHQQSAFKNFFEKRAKYPKFKKRNSRQSATYSCAGYTYKDGQLKLAKMSEPLDIRWSYDKPDKISTVVVSKDCADRYFVSILIEFDPKPLPVATKRIGVDLGVRDLMVTSDGFKSGTLKLTSKYANKLVYAQQQLAKKTKGSNRRNKARIKVAKIHAKIADIRCDNIHKISRKLVNENQVIAFEDLNVAGMVKNRSLSKSISDMGWGELVRQCEYKGDWAGRQVVKINRFFPSTKRCSSCGYTLDSIKLDVKLWDCPECGTKHDRDINAAKNILAAGQAVLARGVTGAGACANA